MAIKEEVRDGYLGDLPEDLRIKIMNIHKMVVDAANTVIKNKAYDSIRNLPWFKTMSEEFLVVPMDKKEVGSVRVYKKGKRFSCMIQLTGHVINNRNDIDHELFHEYIRNIHQAMRAKVRRQYDLTLTCESEHGEHFEGFDVWTKQKTAKEIWEKFDGMKTKKAEFHSESAHPCVLMAEMNDLPAGLQETIMEACDVIMEKNNHGSRRSGKNINNKFSFRAVIGTEDGHPYKIIYDIDSEEIVQGYGAGYNIDDVKNNIHTSRSQHESRNGKVIAIIDMTNNKKVNSIDGYPIVTGHAGVHLSPANIMSIYSDALSKKILMKWKTEFPTGIIPTGTNMKEAKKKLDKHNIKAVHYQIGKPDPNISYKSTSMDEVYRILIGRKPPKNPYNIIKKESTDIGYTELYEHADGTYSGYITISEDCDLIDSAVFRNNCCSFESDYPTKEIVYDEAEHQYLLELTSEYAQKLFEYLSANDTPQQVLTEATEQKYGSTEKEAKRTMHSLSADVINSQKPVTQYTADIYANIITKSLLPVWADGIRKFSIILDTKCKEPVFEFKIPPITQDFISRFIEGREQINGLIRRNPDVKVRMSPAVFATMKEPDDAFKFFKAAIKYYTNGVSRYSDKLMNIYSGMNHDLKQLVSSTKLSGLVVLPLKALFMFDNVDMTNEVTFMINKSDIEGIKTFIRNIYSKYASPEKEKKQILDDLDSLIHHIQESFDFDENMSALVSLNEATQQFYAGKFDNQLEQFHNQWMQEQVDMDWLRNPETPEVKHFQEAFGVKKLKKIPRDLVAYITIETESIRDANDKMMIASYCLSKLEIVEWYIELLEVGSRKYIVPHTKPYLESVRTQLLKCYDNIMKVKIVPPSERPIISVKYPAGYEN